MRMRTGMILFVRNLNIINHSSSYLIKNVLRNKVCEGDQCLQMSVFVCYTNQKKSVKKSNSLTFVKLLNNQI